MKKLAAVLAVVMVLCSVVFVSAFAAPIGDSADTGLVDVSNEVPVSPRADLETSPLPVTLPEETFPAEPILEYGYYSYSVPLSSVPYSTGPLTHVIGISVYRSDGTFVWGKSFDSYSGGSTSVWTASFQIIWGDGSEFYELLPHSSNYVVTFLSSDSSQTVLGGTVVSGTLVEESLVPDLADSIFDIGDAFITFMISSWVVLLPLSAWLVILCIGAIRKLVKGV